MRSPTHRYAAAVALFCAALFSIAVEAQQLTGVFSRKTHGMAGTFDIPIDYTQPIGGILNIEPRAIGAGHRIVFRFDNNPAITSVGTVSVLDSIGNPLGPAPTVTFTSAEVQVVLPVMPNNTRATVVVNGINGTINKSASLGFLLADVDESGNVDNADVLLIKSRTARSANSVIFWSDLNATGAVNAADIVAAKESVGLSLPPAQAVLLSVTKAGAGTGTVTSLPAGISCGATCNVSFASGTYITLTAAPAIGSTFTGWSGGCTGTGTCAVTLTAATTVTATFTLNTFVLTVAKTGTGGGIVTSLPAGINCGVTCSPTYGSGSSITLTAAPAVGSTFTGWSGGGCTGTGACAVTLTAATTVTATFTLNTYALTVAKTGTGTGTVTSALASLNCGTTCSATYGHGTSITLTAAPAVGSTFTGWSGGGCIGTGTCVVTLTAATTVTGTFTLNTYIVTPSAGVNGTISPSTAQTVNYGATTTFTVTPIAGLVATVGGTCGGTLVGTTYITNAITAACTVSATFGLVTFAVTPSAGASGMIIPSTVQTVTSGATKTFSVAPNANYTPSVGGTCGGTLVGPPYTYTTNPIVAACTVVASFVRNSYAVTPSAGANGTISPSTTQTVLSGATKAFSVTAGIGYSAAVGGTCGGTLSGTTFTTSPISGNCSVIATFASTLPKYVSTSGSDTTGDGSIGNPWRTIAKGISTMVSGETLIVRNGTYSGIQNFINLVPSGTSTKYTTIAAETPMLVRIQSTGTLTVADNQLNIPGNYIKVDGFIFDMSGTTNPAFAGVISGNFNTLSRSIFKRGGDIDSSGGLLSVTGSDNLIEDVAGTGACRYCFTQGGLGTTTQRNIWRRVVGRFDYSNATQAKATFATEGGSAVGDVRDHLYQNVIAIDGQNPGNLGGTEKMGGFYASGNTSNITLQGSMVLNEGVGSAGIFMRELGSINNASNTVVWDLRNSLASAPGIVGGNADRLTVGGVIPGLATDLVSSATASLLKPGVNPANLINNTPGAIILKQYGVSGTRWGQVGYDQLTAVDLWPWPYQDRIKSVFAETNNPPAGNSPTLNNSLRGFAANGNGLYGGPISISSYVWEYLGGSCPPTVCTVYSVTPSSGANGSISPLTVQSVAPGGTVSFTLTPNSGYSPSVSGTCGGTLSGAVFTTNTINGSCTVVATFAPANTVVLAWDPVIDGSLVGYRVYYGTVSGVYVQAKGAGLATGNVTSYTITGLSSGTRYYFVVTAFDSTGLESGYSNEVSKIIP